MRDRDAGFEVARILVVLDVGCHDAETVAAAAELAARLDAELAGLFIEDINLFRVAALPVARHLNVYAAAASPIDAAHLGSELKTIAARAEAAIGAAARSRALRWSFRTARGDLAAELTAAAVAGDLVVVGSAMPLPGLEAPIRSPLGPAARRTQRPVMLLPRRPTLRRPLAIAAAVSAHAERALAAAARLGAGAGRQLDVLSLPGVPDLMAEVEAWAADWLGRRGLTPRFLRAEACDVDCVAQVALAAGTDILVLSSDAPLEDDGGEQLLIRGGRPVLVVR